METKGYRPGPLWALKNDLENLESPRCGRHSAYMAMHTQFKEEMLSTVAATLNLTAITPSDRPVVCYMSRRLQKERRRYFKAELDSTVEGALRDWTDRNEDVVEFSVLEFDATVPIKEQIERARRCSILFGPHGAGLGQQIWTLRGLHVIEIGTDPSGCRSYSRAMAAWYGHSYWCFNERKGHNIKV